MSGLIIRWNREREQWDVLRLGEFGRYVCSFPTLAEAERYVIEHGGET